MLLVTTSLRILLEILPYIVYMQTVISKHLKPCGYLFNYWSLSTSGEIYQFCVSAYSGDHICCPVSTSACYQWQLSYDSICLGNNYWVLNETKQYKQQPNTEHFGLVNYSFNTLNIHSKIIGQIVTVVNAAFLFFETSKLWALIMYIL